MSSPVRPIRTIITNDDPVGYVNRLLMGTPTRGTVRIEWHNASKSMLVPPNWSMVTMTQPMSTFIPVRFQVADAQNIIVGHCLQHDFEWLLLLEDDVIPPTDLLVKLNEYMRTGKYPVVSGLYYTKSDPSEPLVYRGRGTGAFRDWTMGDEVWCDGVPTGCLLIHHSILKAMSEDSEQYAIGGLTTRRVFSSANRMWLDPETGSVNTTSCTSDLDWCWRVIKDGYFKKAGWDEYEGLEFPFLVDTSIQCPHITPEGQVFPPPFVAATEEEEPPADLGVSVADGTETSEQLTS